MNIKEIKLLLKKYGIRPKHRLGQNFLASEEVIQRQLEYAGVGGEDTVLEIGAGIGTLTEFLLQRAKKVYAVEVDRKLVEVLEERFRSANIEIIHGDAVKVALPRFDKVVSNIPYEISSPITFRLLKLKFKKAVLTYQREFAERLAAKPGESNYSRLSVAAYYYANLKLLELLPPSIFYPPPRVNSAVVELIPKRPPFKVDEEKYFNLIARLFTHKRKTLRNAMLDSFATIYGRKCDKREQRKIVENSLPREFLEKRVFRLMPEELAEITQRLET